MLCDLLSFLSSVLLLSQIGQFCPRIRVFAKKDTLYSKAV